MPPTHPMAPTMLSPARSRAPKEALRLGATGGPEESRRRTRTYVRANSIVFLKTRERYGGLSNMAGGFPLRINGIHILTSEALYQACRFPHRPDVQRLIIAQRSPMTAKMKAKPHRSDSRSDWSRVRVAVMRWCLRVKLAQHWDTFGKLLLDTGDLPIVEESRRDDFWGAKPVDARTLVGVNALGRLLMELRQHARSEQQESILTVEPPGLPRFLIGGRPIERILASQAGGTEPTEPVTGKPSRSVPDAAPAPASASLPLSGSPASATPLVREDSSAWPTRGALQPYRVYRDSGVDWLGKVPAHWEVREIGRIGRLFKGRGGTKEDDTDSGIPCVRYGDLYTHHELFITGSRAYVAPEAAVHYTPLLRGDVLFAGSGETIDEIGRSAVNLLNGPACCGGDVIVFRPSIDVDARFLGYAMGCPPAAYQKACMGRGITVMHIYGSELKYMSIALPPLSEQAAIVRFLEDADRRIRCCIREKQKLTALLEEHKTAMIQVAVTGQVNLQTGRPYPAYRDSGVEWLGAVPAHWDVLRSKRVFRPRTELARPGDTQLSATQAYGVIAQADYEERIGRKVTKILRHLDQRRHVEVDDFVISMRSFQGGLERAWKIGCIRSSYIVLQAATELIVGYFGHLFKSVDYIVALQSTANFIRDGQDLNFENFCRVDLPFPPKEEQQQIAQAVDRGTDHIASNMERVHRQIGSLREYRARLVADVVTGKLDVREAAARLPGSGSARH